MSQKGKNNSDVHIFTCEFCQKKLSVPKTVKAKKGRCPNCGRWINLPDKKNE